MPPLKESTRLLIKLKTNAVKMSPADCERFMRVVELLEFWEKREGRKKEEERRLLLQELLQGEKEIKEEERQLLLQELLQEKKENEEERQFLQELLQEEKEKETKRRLFLQEKKEKETQRKHRLDEEHERKRRMFRQYKGCSSFYGHDDRTSTTYVMQGYDDHKEKASMPPPPMKGSVAGAFLKRCRSRSLRRQPPRGPVFSKKMPWRWEAAAQRHRPSSMPREEAGHQHGPPSDNR